MSLAYAMLTRHLTVALATVGLDPYRGLFHAPRYERPALALDAMESFRPLIVTSVVLSAVDKGEVSAGDSVSGATGAALIDVGPADRSELAVESIGETFAAIEREAVVV